MKINWQTRSSKLILNPRTPDSLVDQFAELQKEFELEGHIYLATSGTTTINPEQLKLVAISKEALLASAESVNRLISATAEDVWINALPYFHVGGLSILARSFLSQSLVVDFKPKWNAGEFVRFLEAKKGTICSLVPRQVYDLVQQRLSPPKFLRVVFIGGGAMDERSFQVARELGWPLLPTFGCTEAGSQIATAPYSSLKKFDQPELRVLPHLKAVADSEGFLCVQGRSLLTGYCLCIDGKNRFLDPKKKGWFRSEDRVEVSGASLKFLGRDSDFVKVNGEGVNLHRLRSVLSGVCRQTPKVEILAAKEPVKGCQLILVGTLNEEKLEETVKRFNAQVYPYERITAYISVEKMPKTTLGKVRTQELLAKIGLEPAT